MCELKEEQQQQQHALGGTARLCGNLRWKQPGPPIPAQQLRHSVEVIKRTRLITGGQHLIALQCFPLHRTVLMAAGLAGELGSGLRMGTASLDQEFSTKPIRF